MYATENVGRKRVWSFEQCIFNNSAFWLHISHKLIKNDGRDIFCLLIRKNFIFCMKILCFVCNQKLFLHYFHGSHFHSFNHFFIRIFVIKLGLMFIVTMQLEFIEQTITIQFTLWLNTSLPVEMNAKQNFGAVLFQ